MHIYKYLFWVMVITVCSLVQTQAQVPVPYTTDFDDLPNDSIGWTHYALSGTDDWELGVPAGVKFNQASSLYNAWVTNLTGGYNVSSDRYLETPYFDLTDTVDGYYLSFYQKAEALTNTTLRFEYSIDHGNTWSVLNDPTVPKINWQNSSNTFSRTYTSYFNYSYPALWQLQGQDSVKFRFRISSTSVATGEGWMIDNFAINKEVLNIYATHTDTVVISQNCPEFEAEFFVGFQSSYNIAKYDEMHVYFSTDTILDPTDSLLLTDAWYTTTNVHRDYQFDNLPDINAGYAYLLYFVDAVDSVKETNETDNIGWVVLKIDSTYSLPFIDDFDNNQEPWQTVLDKNPKIDMWELGEGYAHHLEGAHSGKNAWHTSLNSIIDLSSCGTSCNLQYKESPHVDLSADTNDLVISFWYKNQKYILQSSAQTGVTYSVNCGVTWRYFPTAVIRNCLDDEWDYYNMRLDPIDTMVDVMFRISHYNISGKEGVAFDDVYIGRAAADISIERKHDKRFSSTTLASDTLKYFVSNSGLDSLPPTTTAFYWSADTILDASDVFLGARLEQGMFDTTNVWSYFKYTKPTTQAGTYYIFYKLDTLNEVAEMREYNNIGYFTLIQSPIASVPYYNDFETQIDNWRHDASVGADEWEWTEPKGTKLNAAYSGTKVWITQDTGLVTSMSRMHLYTPIFDLTTMANPVLEFNMNYYLGGHIPTMGGNMSYSIDGGASWLLLDTTNQSFSKWYTNMDFEASVGIDKIISAVWNDKLSGQREPTFHGINRYNSRDVTQNEHYAIDISFLSGEPSVQFRFNFGVALNVPRSGVPDNETEGYMVDDFSISDHTIDLTVRGKKSLMLSRTSIWIRFNMDVKNWGNYFSAPSEVRYYLSADTVLDASDVFIGQADLPGVRPLHHYYIEGKFSSPGNLVSKNYLIYSIDESNVNAETNELNNVGYWPLNVGGVVSYPYAETFNDSIVSGWNSYVQTQPGVNAYSFHRFRNMIAPGELSFGTNLHSGQMFTDFMYDIFSNRYIPYLYLETPSFDFSSMDTIALNFEMYCAGSNYFSFSNGGNMHYSTDGGYNWQVLAYSLGANNNWYNFSPTTSLNGEPSWIDGGSVDTLKPRYFDLSFLKGLPNVKFRYQYRSKQINSGLHGMRIDNFSIDAQTVDYKAVDQYTPIQASLNQPTIAVNYRITNLGESAGRRITTEFHWSADSIWQASDPILTSAYNPPIASGDTLYSVINLTYRVPITQTTYYIFYRLDTGNDLMETNENNNLGSFKVTFDPYTNYASITQGDTIYGATNIPTIDANYKIVNTGIAPGTNSETGFYWSLDSVLTSNLISLVPETGILAGDTLSKTISITYPVPITQPSYYLFYVADDTDSLFEANELDNKGFLTVVFNYTNYQPLSMGDTIFADRTLPTFDINYAIENNGKLAGLVSKTGFYWSTDSLINGQDIKVNTATEPIINGLDTLTGYLTIQYPDTVSGEVYYLMYRTDDDYAVDELNETDNVGYFVVVFDLNNAISTSSFGDMQMYANQRNVIVAVNKELKYGLFELNLINTFGQLVYSTEVELKQGINQFELPYTLASGIYVISLSNSLEKYTLRTVLAH